METDYKTRLINRLQNCRQQIKASKASLVFWSNELRLAADALSGETQLSFENLIKQESYNEPA